MQARIPFVSAVYFPVRQPTESIHKLCCVLTVLASKGNLVQLSGAVRQAFPCALFRCNVTGLEKALNETFKRKPLKHAKKVVNKTYNYEFMMHLLTFRSLILRKDQDEQVTNA